MAALSRVSGEPPAMKFGVWPAGRDITWKMLGFCVDKKKTDEASIYIFSFNSKLNS
jgi:hypothetical protein